jgi:hypothetical protein
MVLHIQIVTAGREAVMCLESKKFGLKIPFMLLMNPNFLKYVSIKMYNFEIAVRHKSGQVELQMEHMRLEWEKQRGVDCTTEVFLLAGCTQTTQLDQTTTENIQTDRRAKARGELLTAPRRSGEER